MGGHAADAGKSLKVLVIEDEETAIKLYTQLLKQMGHVPVIATRGKDAVERVKKERFDFVILDLKLPDIPGMEVLKSIKEKIGDAPVIIVTAHPSLESSVEALRTGGVYDYITKPFSQQELSFVIERVIEKAKLMIENRHLLRRLEATNQALSERVEELEKFARMAARYDEMIADLSKKIRDMEARNNQKKD